MATELFQSEGTDTPLHPGEMLAEELQARGLSQRELALQMRRPAKMVSDIVRGKRAITAATALDLERALGVSARLWMNLQSSYELDVARLRRGQKTA
jgi:addiction module HigA family antidote